MRRTMRWWLALAAVAMAGCGAREEAEAVPVGHLGPLSGPERGR